VAGVGVATHVGQLWITWAFRLERAGRAFGFVYAGVDGGVQVPGATPSWALAG